MAEYIQLLFKDVTAEQSSVLIAELSEAGFNGFEEEETVLKAFVDASDFDEAVVNDIVQQINVSFSKELIKETNWNQVWESNFQPVLVDDFVGIRASFHEPIQNVKEEIVITPKMSFGTGHHATTHMMIQQLRELDLVNKSVLDFGTGTGVLAILAEKLGAKKVVALDNDDWSIENSRENVLQNNCTGIEIRKVESIAGEGSFDVILANINKHVILDNFPDLVKQLAPAGVLVLSGVLCSDEAEMIRVAEDSGIYARNVLKRHNWLCMSLSR